MSRPSKKFKKSVPAIDPEKLDSLHTKQLLGRLRTLQQCEISPENSDMTQEEINATDGIIFKETPEWNIAYQQLKSILETREHIPTGAQRAERRKLQAKKMRNS